MAQIQRCRKRKRQFRKRLFQALEARQLLAADFIVDAAGKDVELEVLGDQVRVIDVSDPTTPLLSEFVDDIDSRKIEITSNSFLVDSPVLLQGTRCLLMRTRLFLSHKLC